jgi:DNA-binding NtrC family response regulator
MIERAVIISEGERITAHDLCAGLPEQLVSAGSPRAVTEPACSADGESPSLKQQEDQYIRKIFAETGESVSKTCEILGINRTTLWRRLKK